MPTALPGPRTARTEWLHWLFVQGDRVISCSLDIRRDGTYKGILLPLWSPESHVTEAFRAPADAFRWQESMREHLQAAGWLLVEGRLVSSTS